MRRTPNDPCWCGSGLLYRHCHHDIDTAPQDRRVEAARQVYDRGWRLNAKHFGSQGAYTWMASQLRPFAPRRILDIGCGDGSGLVALVQEFGQENVEIISLDENPECLRSARLQLGDRGMECSAISRQQVRTLGPNSHSLELETGKLTIPSRITLIESDILSDDEIVPFLSQLPKFDAVTVWLVGSHMLRRECQNLDSLNIQSSTHYRLRVQNKAYELADEVLARGGVLQVVDREELPATQELREDILNGHREQASVTDLIVSDLDYMPYEERASGGIRMVATPGTSGRLGDLSQIAMCSVISLKEGKSEGDTV